MYTYTMRIDKDSYTVCFINNDNRMLYTNNVQHNVSHYSFFI